MPHDELEGYRPLHERRGTAHADDLAQEDLVRTRDILATVALRRGEIHLARSQARAIEQERAQYQLRALAADSVAEQIRALMSDRARGAQQAASCR
jgi:hypothetical protein